VDRKTTIRQFVQSLLTQKGDQRPFNDGDSLVFGGRLQSIDVVDVVMFLEEQWGVDFASIGFDENLLDSVNAIDALVQQAAVSR